MRCSGMKKCFHNVIMGLDIYLILGYSGYTKSVTSKELDYVYC